MSAEHTALPWRIDRQDHTHLYTGERSGLTAFVAYDTDNNQVFSIVGNEANAAFIVRGCNSFDELVAAVENSVSNLRHENSSHPKGCLCAYCDRYRELSALLAKARGES